MAVRHTRYQSKCGSTNVWYKTHCVMQNRLVQLSLIFNFHKRINLIEQFSNQAERWVTLIHIGTLQPVNRRPRVETYGVFHVTWVLSTHQYSQQRNTKANVYFSVKQANVSNAQSKCGARWARAEHMRNLRKRKLGDHDQKLLKPYGRWFEFFDSYSTLWSTVVSVALD